MALSSFLAFLGMTMLSIHSR
ncbi:hypothetical protein ENHY17A_50019 [Moraxellaceae bacterium 17A]|nr:hypothetical protein ENHY17A_50019 [Moraxellaceae bacterium 17A]